MSAFQVVIAPLVDSGIGPLGLIDRKAGYQDL